VDRKRILRLLFVAAALLVAMVVLQHWPKDQTVHYVLGDGAMRVRELDARWADDDASASQEDWTRKDSFRYTQGEAPRVVTAAPHLPDGDYTVEIEILAANEHSLVKRHVTLAGSGSTSIDLGPAVPR
jgi:hypothetical protein